MDIAIGALIVALAALLAERLAARRRRRMLKRLADGWGRAPAAAVDREALDDIASYWREYAGYAGVSDAVDDITWNDLDMDAVFRRLDRADSGVGEELLYAMLRDIGTGDGELAARRARVAFAESHPDQRLKMRAALAALGRARHHGASAYLFRPSAKAPRHGALYRLLAALPIVFLLLGLLHPAFLFGIAASFAVNMAVFYRSRQLWMGEIAAVRHIAAVVRAADRLKDACVPGLDDDGRRLADLCRELRPVRRWNALFAMQRTGDLDFVTDYLRIAFQLDMLCLIGLTAFFQRHGEALRAVYRLVGEIDACVAIANLRASGERLCAPAFSAGPGLRAEGLAHPLIANPVRNDLLWDRPMLITGSNASGKSTFTKAVAINAILAQSVCLCAAHSFSLPRCRVMSSMALRDDVRGGDSYFIVEIKSLKRIVDALDGRPLLCFIDEILRGTNTAERIAASSALLNHLAAAGCLCMAATHDQELTALCPRYRQVHFREELTDRGMTFPYRLLEGPADTRNAIALLKHMDFPLPVVDEAERAVQRHQATGAWRE